MHEAHRRAEARPPRRARRSTDRTGPLPPPAGRTSATLAFMSSGKSSQKPSVRSSVRPRSHPGRRRVPAGMDPAYVTRPAALVPVVHSASLTHATRWAQRAPHRSQRGARAAAAPPTASNDHACGWNTVGMRPRTTSRAAGPALALCACTSSGRTSSISRASRRISPAGPGPGDRPARHSRASAPRSRRPAASSPPGHPAVTRRPVVSWARTRSSTTRATPPSTGCARCRTRGRKSGAGAARGVRVGTRVMPARSRRRKKRRLTTRPAGKRAGSPAGHHRVADAEGAGHEETRTYVLES